MLSCERNKHSTAANLRISENRKSNQPAKAENRGEREQQITAKKEKKMKKLVQIIVDRKPKKTIEKLLDRPKRKSLAFPAKGKFCYWKAVTTCFHLNWFKRFFYASGRLCFQHRHLYQAHQNLLSGISWLDDIGQRKIQETQTRPAPGYRCL